MRPLEGRSAQALVVLVDERKDERFNIPHTAAAPSALTEVIDQMDRAARRAAEANLAPDTAAFVRQADQIFAASGAPLVDDVRNLWAGQSAAAHPLDRRRPQRHLVVYPQKCLAPVGLGRAQI